MNSKFLYDPNQTTFVPDYDKCVSNEACDDQFKKRLHKFKFTQRKALRLAFHDCVNYQTGQGMLEDFYLKGKNLNLNFPAFF